MPLAGNVKLKNFLAVAAGVVFLGGIALVLGTVTVCSGFLEEPDEAAAPEVPAVAPAPAEAPPAAVAAPVDPEPGVDAAPVADPDRPWDVVLLGWQGKDLGAPKIKDASKGTAWKINLYQDEGQTTANRAKVDIDRDDLWDEKWTFAPDGVSRKVSPGDDESYTETWTWTGAEWTGP